MLGIGTIIYVIYIAYLIAFERYYRSQHTAVETPISQERSVREALDDLSIDDVRFFERLSLIIRTYLENSKQVALATKKTPRDIHRESISYELKDILDICAHYEYTEEKASTEEKIKIIVRLKNIV